MAVSKYDKENLSQEDQNKIADVTSKAEKGEISWSDAHSQAEALRNQANYSGGQYGDGYYKLGDDSGGFGNASPSGSGGGSSGSESAQHFDTSGFRDTLDQWLQNAQQQQQAQIDYAVDKNVQDLRQQEDESNEQFQTMRDQVDLDEAKAKDNQALYSESRGDKGGIGAAQYDSVMNTAAKNRLAVNQQQTKVATETARQISDLRAQGEFEKADALLSLSQTYLSQLMSLEQWAAQYNLSVDQFNASLDQWKQEFNASLDQWDASFGLQVGELMGTYNGKPTLGSQQLTAEKEQQKIDTLANTGATLLAAGVVPSQSQLDAMGMTASQAKSYISALKASQKKSSGSGSSGSKSSGSSSSSGSLSSGWGTDAWYESLGNAASRAGQSVSDYLNQNYKSLGMTQSQAKDYAEKYNSWSKNRNNWPNLGSNTPDYDTILKNSSSGAYGKKFNLVLNVVQNMSSRDNQTQDEVADYLMKQMSLGNINQAGVTVIMQALGI